MSKTTTHPTLTRQLITQLLLLALLCQMLAPLAEAAGRAQGAKTRNSRRVVVSDVNSEGGLRKSESTIGVQSLTEEAAVGITQGSTCPAASARPAASVLTYTGQANAYCGESLPVSALLMDECGNPLAGQQVNFTVGAVTASGTTDDNGVASASLILPAANAPLPLVVNFTGNSDYSQAQDSASVRVERANTSIRYQGKTVLAAGVTEPVSAVLTDIHDGSPIPNAVLNFEVGTVRASATTDTNGVATTDIQIPATETFERSPMRISFGGDDCRGPATASVETTAYLRTSFVVWGGNSARLRLGQSVNFWGHSWARQVSQGDYKAHNDFKGYADTVRQFQLCQVSARTSSQPPLDDSCWSTKPGQSFPPQIIPEYIGGIVTTSMDKRGAPDFGNIAALAVVKVAPEPRYGAVPGKPGFGSIVAVIADGEGVFGGSPSLTISQTQPASVLPSQNFGVDLTVTNNSTAPAANVQINESFTNLTPPSATGAVGTLPPSSSQARRFGATVPAMPPRRENESSVSYQKRLGAAEGIVYSAHGLISFQDATGRAFPPVAVASSSTLQLPRLAIGISAESCFTPGATIPYVIRLVNVGRAAASSATAVVTFADGTTSRIETTNLEPGRVFSTTLNWKVPVIAAKGATETDADYISRLASFDGKLLKTAVSVTWKDVIGNVYGAVDQECSSVVRVPILSQNAQAPQSMLPSQKTTLASAVRNAGSGHSPQARLRVNNPDSSVFDASPFSLAAGGSSNVPTTLTAPPVLPKGQDETDEAYRARLQAADNRPIDFSLALEWMDASGNNYGPVTGLLRSTQVLPVVLLSLSAPETVEAGETITYRVTVENLGHAEASGFNPSLTLPGGNSQPVTMPAVSLPPGDRQSAIVNFNVPAAHPEGQVSAQAIVNWKDALANGYGPMSASAATNVLNPNRPPVVNAGIDQSIVLPAPVTLNGTASDDGKPVGSLLTLQWTKVSGPGAVTFANPAQAVTAASFSAEGTYVLRLSASDSVLGASDEATVTVTLPPSEPTYSDAADLTQGEGINVVSDEVKNLHLSNEATPFNFIWVAVSSKGTIVKIDTDTGKVLGEYFSSPAGQPRNPSRTTVDLNGNVWASNRDGNSVLRIGLVENGQCTDRNGNGVIDTSQAQNDIRPWTNAGGVDTDGGVDTAQDECVINYTRVRAHGTRHVSVNTANDVWVSGTGGHQFDLIDGVTGQIKRQEPSVGYGGYGGLIDRKGVIWSARSLMRWDTALPLKGANGGNWRGYSHDSYGLCIDGQGNVWNTALGGNAIHKYASDGTHLGTFNHGSHYAQGCVVDRNNHVWVAHSLYGGTVGHLKSDGTWLGNVPVGSGPTGVAVDAKGKIWATNHNSRNVSRIDPELGPMGADGETRIGQVDLTTVDLKGSLYNYSDMTGSTLSGAPSGGTWSQVFDSQLAEAQWGVVGWDGRTCSDSSLLVSVSSSRDGKTFSAPIAAQNGTNFSIPAGRYLKVSVNFKRAGSGESPFLTGLTVGTKGFKLPAVNNAPPIVDAGLDQTATIPNAANLVGNACDAGRVSGLAVSWEKIEGPGAVTFANARVPATSATFTEPGEYRLRLTAADSELSSNDEMTVLVLPFNDPPAVSAGVDQAVILPASAPLTGTVTDDALPKNSSVAVSWSKLSGPGEVAFVDATRANTSASFNQPGDYVLRLTGDDSQLANVDDIKIKVYPPNSAPTVNAGDDRTIRLPEKATLDATVADDGLPLGKILTFAWSKVSGPGTVSFAKASAADTTASFSLPGTYLLRLTAGDTQLSTSDELTVVVNPANQPPSVNAGPDQVITHPDAANLSGTVADDALPEGQIVTAAWSKVSGPGVVTFTPPGAASTTASFSEPGAYVLRLTASDSALTRSDDVAVNVNPSPVNQPPNVNAGLDQTITLPAKATLAAAATDDRQPSGSALTLAWSKASGPGTVTFGNAASATTTAAFSSTGQYVLRLTASDSALTTADEISITVLPPNQPPVVKAGLDQIISFPNPTANLSGTATDDGQPQGGALTVAWSKVSGPGEVSFADASAPATAVTFSAGGRYVLRLTASDSSLIRTDDVAVTVNQSPAVNAGADISINMPDAANLAGTVTDDALPPGKTIVVAWTKISGPGTVTFSKPTVAATAATFGEVGTYVLRLTANDSLLEDGDELTVTVLPPLPAPPAVAILSPADGADITSRIDVTGSVSSGSWRLEYSLGPDPAAPGSSVWTTFASGTAPVANSVLGTFDPTLLLNGTYAVRLTATDDAGRSSSIVKTTAVTGQQKVGNFTITYEDLAVPVAGLPIQLTRTYDSRDKRVGDFGVGWTLGIKNVRLEKSVELGSHWRGVVSGGRFPQYCLQPDRPNIVTITFPDERIYKFQATTTRQCQSLVPIEFARFGFTPMPGTRGTLVPEASLDVWVIGGYPGPVELYDASGQEVDAYDPTVFRFTDENGNVYVIDQKLGVRSISDSNGNKLTINRDGITHSAGHSVGFVRDALGRITRITDPAGNAMTYTYDARGDLINHTDRESAQTSFTYNETHGLLDIIDPRGLRPVRNEYDNNGRLISQTDASGRRVVYAHDLNARQELITDRLGRSMLYEYDNRGNILRVTDPGGGVKNFTYDSRNNVLSEIDPLGHKRAYTYDTANNLVRRVDPAGKTTTFTYNSRGDTLTVADERGVIVTNTYDAKGNLTASTDALGNVTSRTYGIGGRLETQTDAQGGLTRYEYDRAGNMAKMFDPLGNVKSYTYNAGNHPLTMSVSRTTPSGTATLVTAFQYDKSDRLIKTTFPDGAALSQSYTPNGRIAVRIDPLGRKLSHEYDDLGRPVRLVFADGTAEETTYDAEGRRLTSKDRAGRVTRFEYDRLSRLISTTYPDGVTKKSAYDAIGRLVSSTDEEGHTTRYEYVPNCGEGTLCAKTIDALNNTTVSTFNVHGNLLSVTDAANRTTRYDYDILNRQTRVIYADSTSASIAYDALGNVSSKTDPAGKTTRFAYDRLGRLSKVTEADTQTTAYTYDEAGNLVSQVDALGRVTRYEYDGHNRRVKRVLPLGMSETYAYDAVGNLIGKTDFGAKTTGYEYDTMNRLVRKRPDPSLRESAVSFTYTATGMRAAMEDSTGTTTYSYDSRDRLTSKATPRGTLSYTYDRVGNVLSLRSSNANGASASYSYDALNRLSNVTDEGTQGSLRPAAGQTAYSYDAVGNQTGHLYPNGVRTAYAFDSLNRLTELSLSKATQLAGFAYTLGPAGNRLSVTELSGRKVSYTYDDLRRLTGEEVSGVQAGGGSVSYTYDAVGNRLSRTSTLTPIASATYAYDANDRLTSDTYDASGNTAAAAGKTYSYDFENRLKAANNDEVKITYDGDGNRVAQTVGGVTTSYLVDDLNPTGYAQVVEEIVGGRVTRVYTYGHTLICQNQLIDGDWRLSFYGYDGHGSVRLLTDREGNVTDTYDYDAFGNLLRRTGTTPNEYLYAGQRRDAALGLDYLRARYMNPDTGRFWSMDSYEGTGSDPLSLHKYLYANADPVGHIDPSGNITLAHLSMAVGVALTLQSGVAFLATPSAANAAFLMFDIFTAPAGFGKALKKVFGKGAGVIADLALEGVKRPGRLSEVAAKVWLHAKSMHMFLDEKALQQILTKYKRANDAVVDFVAMDGPFLTLVEAKQSLNFTYIEEAVEGMGKFRNSIEGLAQFYDEGLEVMPEISRFVITYKETTNMGSFWRIASDGRLLKKIKGTEDFREVSVKAMIGGVLREIPAYAEKIPF